MLIVGDMMFLDQFWMRSSKMIMYVVPIHNVCCNYSHTFAYMRTLIFVHNYDCSPTYDNLPYTTYYVAHIRMFSNINRT